MVERERGVRIRVTSRACHTPSRPHHSPPQGKEGSGNHKTPCIAPPNRHALGSLQNGARRHARGREERGRRAPVRRSHSSWCSSRFASRANTRSPSRLLDASAHGTGTAHPAADESAFLCEQTCSRGCGCGCARKQRREADAGRGRFGRKAERAATCLLELSAGRAYLECRCPGTDKNGKVME